ncbi:MAG: ABC transporter ATP-binding protein [Pseudomonadota bacterium]
MIPVDAKGLTKRFGAFTAVDRIDFTVRAGECLGFLGPNGAGKTTTIRMVCAYTPITEGSIRVFDLEVSDSPREIKAGLGICPQEDNLDPDFTVRKNLLMYARYFNMEKREARRRAEELLAFVQLSDRADTDIRELSGGMKRRLILARALMNRPKLLVLDEPTTGLDPQARQLIWQRIRQLRSEGVSVLLTTHYMEEAAVLCDRVILMDQGKIVLEGTPKQLIADEIGRDVVECWDVGEEFRRLLGTKKWEHEEVEGRIYLYDRSGGAIEAELARDLPSQPRMIRPATLEDVFLRRSGRRLKE